MLLLTGVLLLFSAGTYIAVYKLLLGNFDDLLASQASLIVQTVDFSGHNLTIQNDSLRADHRNDEHLTRIYHSDGTLIYDDNPQEQMPELADAVRRALGGDRQIIQVRGFADRTLRDKANPDAPSNRRISVIVRYQMHDSPNSDKPGAAEKAPAPEKAAEHH